MLSQLSNNSIDQFFMDCTYKVVPPNIYRYKLMVIWGIDLQKNKTVLCALILLGKENEKTFKNIFDYLSSQYSFKPRRFMYDFNIAQIKSIKSIFPECLIHTCIFHFSQAIWQNFKKYNLTGKGTYNDNSELLFNIQLMNFMDRGKIEEFFKKLKKNIRIINIKNFFHILIGFGEAQDNPFYGIIMIFSKMNKI